jgi:hypothetical protein
MLALRVSVAIGLAPVALVGCGGNSPTGPAPATTGPPLQRLVAYSACMRRNGVPSFPDPTTQGNLLITPSDHINPASPQVKRAQSACEKLSPESIRGAGMTPAQHAKALAAMTRYVQCMRKHGVAMANPFSGPNGGVGIVLPRNIDLNSEQYKRAEAACKHFVPNGG